MKFLLKHPFPKKPENFLAIHNYTRLNDLFNYIINGVMFSALNTFSNDTLINSSLENHFIPKFTIPDVIWCHDCLIFNKLCPFSQHCAFTTSKSDTEKKIWSHHGTINVMNDSSHNRSSHNRFSGPVKAAEDTYGIY